MVYRMLNIPMSKEDVEEEKEKIFQIAKVNGFDRSLIQTIIDKQKRSIFIKKNTTLNNRIDKKKIPRMRLSYYPPLTNKIKDVLKSVGISTAYASDNKIKNALCNNKDKVNKSDKPGIYKMKCETCKKFYIGKTSRRCSCRWKEHMKAIEKEDLRSAVAKHVVDNPTHKIVEKNSELIRHVRREQYLDAWESFYIDKHKGEIMNIRPPALESALFKYMT